MKKFRIPRKLKKKISKKIYLYPPDKDGSSVMGFPSSNENDFKAYKSGLLTSPFEMTKKKIKEVRLKYETVYYKPCELTDEELTLAVEEVFSKEYRSEALSVLRKSKKHDIAIKDYYTFCNAFKLKEFNIACMSIDGAEYSLRSK